MHQLPLYFWIAPVAALATLGAAWWCFGSVMRQDAGTDRMREIAGYVKEGARAYLRRQYRTVGTVFAVITAILSVLAMLGLQNPFVPVAFLTGGFFSALCGYIGMTIATEASSRTAWGAKQSLDRGLRIAFRAGAVMGLVVVGFGLLDISLWFVALSSIYDGNFLGFGADLAEHLGLGSFSEATATNIVFVKGKLAEITTTMLTFGMGASTQSLFARVGGGIYTKAADLGADLVGKVEAGIPEDDPRNPATIADNVGDNVGDVAGMGADLYESYCGCILATAALGASLALIGSDIATPEEALKYVIAPLLVAGLGAVLSIVGVFIVRTKENATQGELLRSLNIGVWVPSILIAVAVFAVCVSLGLSTGIALSVVTGLVAGVVIGKGTEYYTSDEYRPTRDIAQAAQMGDATAVISGLGLGFRSVGIPTVTIALGILLAFGFAGGFEQFHHGLYGISFAAVGMLATLGVTLATDAYGPIADNAGGNCEMSGLGAEVRARTDQLDMLGNTTAATGKGFAIGSAGLTALALLVAYIEELRIWIGKFAHDGETLTVGRQIFTATAAQAADYNATLADGATPALGVDRATVTDFVRAFDLNIMNPAVVIGLFIGAMVAFVFCALTMQAVGRAAEAMVAEVRRQFREIKGIMSGETTPDYAACVSISTRGAQEAMITPSLLALLTPVAVGLLFGVPAVFGMLLGALTSGFVLAVMLNNAGGAWDNAKKFVEKGHYGGKGSDVHKATVVGDTIGDPFKDTSGPSLNILIKIMSMVSVVIAGVVVAHGGWLTQLFGN